MGGDLSTAPPRDPSIVWIVDKISNVLQRICIQIKNTPNLKRLLVLATDAEEIAGLLKSEPYRFLFDHPAFRIGVIDPNTPPDPDTYRGLFQPTEWDIANESKFFYSFRPEFKGSEEWLAQIQGIFHMILIFFREGLGSSAFTEDAFLGFRNMMRNLPRILKSPDLRNWKGAGRQKPAFLVGAGPSVKPQLEHLAQLQNDVIIIAADTMLKPLSKYGIRPHLLASIERAPEIIGLLDDPKEHSNSFLVGSAVLEPECFSKFNGPSSIYLTQIPPSKYFPFTRSRFETGHSCMGLAMALSSYLECDPIFVMGIDLCWGEEGESHMQDVPYLQKDFYIQQNKTFYKNSFATQNSQGKTVRTNFFWTAFKQQFEYWARVAPSKIYNLSPTGLPLKGIPQLRIEEIKLSTRATHFDQELRQKWPYQRTKEIRSEVEQFLASSSSVVEGLEALSKRSQNLSPLNVFKELESIKFYDAILHPILKGDVYNLRNASDEKAEMSRVNLLTYFKKLSSIFSETRKDLKAILQDPQQSRELY